jgi:hypothetical protein
MQYIRNALSKLFNIRDNSSSTNGNLLIDKFYRHDLTKALMKPVDKNQLPIPWFTYPAIEFLQQYDLSTKTVFEWGCGNSSIYFSDHAANVISVEHDMEWYDKMKQTLKGNQVLRHLSLEEYPSSIKDFAKKFDIIVIDGQRRFDCARECIPFLKDDGMIILDNSDWFYVSAAFLREKLNLLQIDFHGFGPINDYTWTTSFFFNRSFNFPLKYNRQPVNPSGGIAHDEREIIKKEDLLYNTKNELWLKN